MAHDDDKPEAGDDPWAGLEADGLPDLSADSSFSFDDETFGEADAAGELTGEMSGEEQPDVIGDDEPHEADLLAFSAAAADEESPLETAGEPTDSVESPFAFEDEPQPAFGEESPGDADDAAIDDWLSEAGDAGDAAAEAAESSILAGATAAEEAMSEREILDCVSSESAVEIGTGMSGIASASSIEALDTANAPVEDDQDETADPFAAMTAEETTEGVDPFAAMTAAEVAEEADPLAAMATAGDTDAFPAAEENAAAEAQADADMFGFMGGETEGGAEEDAADEAGDDFAGFGAAAAAATAATAAAGGEEGRQAPAKPKRPAPPRKKKPSMVGQLIGVIVGGALAIPITLAILVWGFGKDPFGVAEMVPDSLGFLLPAKFRPGGNAVDLAGAPSLDDLVGTDAGGSGGDGEADLPDASDLADAGSEPEPTPEPMPDEPAATDLASLDGGVGEEKDPLMDLLDESEEATPSPPEPAVPAEPAVPPPPPEPEPLDLGSLDALVADAAAALEAVTALDDPTDPIRRRLLAKWYKSLADYAVEVTSLEQLAAETGRPYGPVEERAAAMRAGLAGQPELLAAAGVLARDWIAYAKRPGDGIVVPATFVSARRAGPWWRSQVTLPATADRPAADLVVLSRLEPAVAPDDTVLVTGLMVDDDVVWAAEIRPVVARDAFSLLGL